MFWTIIGLIGVGMIVFGAIYLLAAVVFDETGDTEETKRDRKILSERWVHTPGKKWFDE